MTLVMCLAHTVRAQPAAEPGGIEHGQRREPEWTAAAVAGAPIPGEEGGRIDAGSGDSTARVVGRGLLLFPRAVFEIALSPVRAAVYLSDRYRLPRRFRRWFYNDDETLGLMPSARFDSDEGVVVGLRAVWRPIAGARASVFAGLGLAYHQVAFAAESHPIADRVVFGVRGELRQRARAPFYGLGNGDERAVDPDAPLVDPVLDPTAIETRFRKRIARASPFVDVRFANLLYLRGAASYSEIGVADASGERALADAYDTSRLIGSADYRTASAELELRYDSRRRVGTSVPRHDRRAAGDASMLWDVRGLRSPALLAAVFAGRNVIAGGGARFWRYGVELQQFVRLGNGPQVIAARLHAEGVSAALDDIPFQELPALGGNVLLRGYPTERFRDRIAITSTLEYQWDLSDYVFASLFVDAGRVYRSRSDLALADVRAGYGIALEGHTRGRFRGRISLASSIDGGLFLELQLASVFATPRREERR